MPQATKGYDAYGHSNEASTQLNSLFTAASSGTAAGTVVNPGTADPTGTTNVVNPNIVTDGWGQFQITTAGSQTTGALRNIYVTQPYAVARPVVATVTTTAGVAAGGTITALMTLTEIEISVGSALTTATTYNIAYQVL
jgi:hypothetical protein